MTRTIAAENVQARYERIDAIVLNQLFDVSSPIKRLFEMDQHRVNGTAYVPRLSLSQVRSSVKRLEKAGAVRSRPRGNGYLWEAVHCTALWPRRGLHWRAHPTREVGEQKPGWPGGDIVTMECPNCGLSWEAELPQ